MAQSSASQLESAGKCSVPRRRLAWSVSHRADRLFPSGHICKLPVPALGQLPAPAPFLLGELRWPRLTVLRDCGYR